MTIGRGGRLAGLLLGVIAMGTSAPAHAERDVDGLEELLPRAESPREREMRTRGLLPASPVIRADAPPLAPIRNCAEWEPLTGVLIRYPLGLPYALLRDLDDTLTLHIVVSAANQGIARVNLAANGVDTSRVQYLVQANDSIWTRDYGPWFVFDGNGDLEIVDHVYNRPARPHDDVIPVFFGVQQGIPVVRHDMWHTGGNYMTDGAGWSMSTALVYSEAQTANGMTSAQVDQLMHDYYGVAPYDVVDDIEAGGIHHIDTWGKFLDEETVLVKRVWPTHGTYAALEQRATLIASLPASTGRNFRVFRVDCQDIGGGVPASYTNSLLANGAVYMPAFNDASHDSAAANAYRAALPGWDVRAHAYAGWLTDDALHCRVMGVPDRFMLRVAHVPIGEATMGPVAVVATVDARSGAAVEFVDLVWRFAGGDWVTTPMAPLGGARFSAQVPAPPVDTGCDYYVLARDLTGREEGSPRVAPAAWHSFPILANPASAVDPLAGVPASTAVAPNPFRDETRFSFELRSVDRVRLDVFDVAGRAVRRLVDGMRPAGAHRIVWDGRDDAGRPAVAGVYYFRLRAAGLSYTRPVVLTR